MSFVQLEFPAFFAFVFLAHRALGGRRAAQNALLLVASAVFYGWVHPWFVALLAGTAVIDFAVGQAIERWPAARWRLVALSVTLNLSLLGWFKYAGWFAEIVASLAERLGRSAPFEPLEVLLPVGISFYTFQSIGYVVAVARRELRAERSFPAFLLFVSFFPQLVAGPIQRAPSLLPQVHGRGTPSWEVVRSGLSLALFGAFEKVVVADSIAPFVDKVFVLQSPPGPLIWAAAAGFTLQIYADFAGYTDMARGLARTLGFELSENFREPFLARTTVEFWQRWHLSLSTWLRDHVLGPLVGDGGAGRWRFAAATLATFVLVGVWHGPSWNFVLFGLWQGAWVLLSGWASRRVPARLAALPGADLVAAALHVATVGLVGSLLFREHRLDRLWAYAHTPPLQAEPEQWYAASVLGVTIAAGAAPLLAQWVYARHVRPRLQGTWAHLPVQTTAWALVGVALFVFYRTTVQDFVYFQF